MKALSLITCAAVLTGCTAPMPEPVEVTGYWTTRDSSWTTITAKTGWDKWDKLVNQQVFFAVSDGGATDNLLIGKNYGIVHPPLTKRGSEKYIRVELSANVRGSKNSPKVIWSGAMEAINASGIAIALPDLFTPEYLRTHEVSVSQFEAFMK